MKITNINVIKTLNEDKYSQKRFPIMMSKMWIIYILSLNNL